MSTSLPSITKTFLRLIIDRALAIQATRLPAHFNLRHRVSYLLHGLEPAVVSVANKFLGPDQTAVDIGANVGFLTRRFAAMVGVNGRVFSFEPDPAVFDFLAFNTRKLSNVALSNIAMSDHCGTSALFLHPTSSMSNSLVNAWENAHPLNVQTSTFDAWVANTNPGRINLIKIDVEGAEPLVLRGMRDTLASSDKPHIIIEFCPENFASHSDEEEIFRILFGSGYTVQRIDARGALHVVHSPTDVHGILNENGYVNLLAQADTI